MNLYGAPSSGIEFHGEDDRYSVVVSCVFYSEEGNKAFLSINQHGMKGTCECDIESFDGAVWRFDSYV